MRLSVNLVNLQQACSAGIDARSLQRRALELKIDQYNVTVTGAISAPSPASGEVFTGSKNAEYRRELLEQARTFAERSDSALGTAEAH